MQLNYKDEPLSDETIQNKDNEKPAKQSKKLSANRSPNVKEKTEKSVFDELSPKEQEQLLYWHGSNINELFPSTQSKETHLEETRQKIQERVLKTLDAVSDIAKKEMPDVSFEDYPKSIFPEIFPDSKESLSKLSKLGKMQDFVESLKTSLPKRVHDQGQSDFVNARVKDFIGNSKSGFSDLYGKTPEQLISENDGRENNNKDFLEAKTILHLEKFANELKESNNEDYWSKVDFSKPFYDQSPEMVKGLVADLYRDMGSSFGMTGVDIPITPEGKQNLWNKLYRHSYDKLPEDSFLKKQLPKEQLESVLTFSVMDKLPKHEKPFIVDAINAVTSSLAALPFYMWGLGELGLLTKTGGSGLFELGGKEFTKRLLMSPVYTQPFSTGNQMFQNISNARSIGDIFMGVAKPYMRGLTEVVGEVSTPIFAKGLGKLSLWNKLNEGIEKVIQNVSGKYNTKFNTAVDWLAISPVTEAGEEEISNFLNTDPSIFTGDFNLRRISLEAIAALGMGLPIGIVSQIANNKLRDNIKNPDNFSDEIGNKIVVFAVQTLKDNPELYNELREQMNAPDKSDFNILESIRNIFGSNPLPEGITLPMVGENKNWDNLSDDILENQYQDATVSTLPNGERGAKLQIKFEDNVNDDKRITNKELKLWGDGYNFLPTENMQDEGITEKRKAEIRQIIRENKIKALQEFGVNPNQNESKPIIRNDEQPNTNTTVVNNENAVQTDPDNDALDKVTEKENARTDLKINLTSNGIVKAIHGETGISVTPHELFDFVQSFNTGNTNTDFNTFKEAWIQKFGPIWLDKSTNITSNRTFLEEMFAVMYHSSIAPSATVDINENGINVAKYENDAYIDADETTKSLISNKELWEQVAKILPENMEAIIVKNISNFGTNYTSFNDLDLGFDSADVEKGLLSIRNGLMKNGYVWLSGIIPGSKTALLIDVRKHLQSQNIDLSNASPEQLNEVYNQINNDLILNELLGENLSTLDKFKRVKGISGKAPQPFVTDTLKDKLSNTNEASSIYYKVVDGKEQINYKYIVLDASTIPTNIKDKIEVGDGAELVTTYLGDVYNDLFGIPYEKRGAMKPKHFDIQKFWKWARSYVLPKSQLEYFMTKNGIAGVVLSSAIKVGKNENMVSWQDITTMQNLPPEFVNEHNLMTDSSLSSKGHISTKASGFGPNVLTTGVTLLMNEKEREVIRDWMKQDFQDAQKELQTLIKDPKLLSDVLVEYARKSGYQESDIVRFIDKTEGLDNLVRLPALMDFFMKGYFKSILLDAVRHSKFGSAPALIPDMGGIQSFANISGANKEAFDDKGFIKRGGYRVIDYYSAKEKKLQVGSHLIEAFNPPGSFADMRAVEVAAILPKEMGRNLYAGNIEEMQQNSGKDFDIDITGIALLRTETDKKVWSILKKLDVDGKYEAMMSKFSQKGQAKTILTRLASNFTQNNPDAEIPEDINPENPKNVQSWSLIAPMVKLNSGGKGVFTLNTRYGVMDNKNPEDWATLNRMSKEGLIGILYNWKAIYTLFLENDYEINGVKANPDTNFNLPMLKVLTDMSLDWTKQYDIGKINFNWNDLIKQLFILPKGMSLKTFSQSIKPLRDAFKLIKLEDKELAKYDYVSYLRQLQNIRLSLATMPKGLENSSLAILTRGIASLELPKFNLTIEQARHSNEVVRAQMLGVKPSDVKKTQVANYALLKTAQLLDVSSILKALSVMGISSKKADMIGNVRDILSFSYSRYKKESRSLVANTWHSWLSAIMENPIFDTAGTTKEVVLGANVQHGYRYRISYVNDKFQYEILGITNGKKTSFETANSWKQFTEKGGENLHRQLFQPDVIRLFDMVKIIDNPIVKNSSDKLLADLFAGIVKTKKFQNIAENTRKAFYLGFMGYLDQLKKDVTAYESILTHKIDVGANIKGGKSDIRVDNSTVTKQEVASYIKPIMLMLDYAMNNDKLAEEMLGTWFNEMNNAIGNEIAKEKQGSVLNGAMPLTIIPLPIQHAEAKGIDVAKLIRVLQKQFGDKFNIVKYIDTLVNENILGNKKDVKRFNKLIERALVETDKKYGAKWRMALMNPLVNSHTIPFDVFVDLFGKKDKLYFGMDDVYEYALNGNKHRIKAWQIQMKFLHWGMQDKAKLISNPQIWWYVQDSIDRNFESKRINLQEVVTSVNTFMMHSSRDIPHIDLEQAIVEQVISDAFDMAESNGFQDKIKSFDLSQDVKKYYEFAKIIYSGTNIPSANELKAIVGAMRFRHIFDNLVPDLIKQQLQNLNHVKDLAAQKENLSAWHVADLFMAELNGMLKQIRNKANYMPHAWLNEEEWLKGAEQMFIQMGQSPERAKISAKQELEKMEATSSHIGGTGQYIDIFFLKRRADMQGYMKTAVPAEKYINQLIRLLRFQQLYANEELAEDLIKDEIPFLIKHAKEMSAILRGANKYGVKMDFKDLRKNDNVIFAVKYFNKRGTVGKVTEDSIEIDGIVYPKSQFNHAFKLDKVTGKYTHDLVQLDDVKQGDFLQFAFKQILKTGKVSKVNETEIELSDGSKYKRFEVEAVRKLHGNNLITRAKLALDKLGIDSDTSKPALGKMTSRLLRLEAEAMLTGTAFAVRNVIGGTLQSIVLYGYKAHSEAVDVLRGKELANPEAIENLTDEHKDLYKLVYDNSIALLGNLSEVMGKLGGVIDVLGNTQNIDATRLQEMILLKTEWDGIKADLSAYGLTDSMKIRAGIRFTRFRSKLVRFANGNFLSFIPFIKRSTLVDPKEGEKQLRFSVALTAALVHTGGNTGLNINDPIQKQMLVAYIDNAVRQTQYLYRVGLDQGILESSPLARTFLVNYLHYPISSFITQIRYFDNMIKQIDQYGVKRILVGGFIDMNETSTDKKRYGTQTIPVTITMFKGSPQEFSFTYADVNYARVFARSFFIGFIGAIIRKAGRSLIPAFRFTAGDTAKGLMQLSALLASSYTNFGADVIWELTSYLLSLTFAPGDDDKYLKLLKRALHDSEQDYIKRSLDNKHDAKFIASYPGDIKKALENEHTLRVIDRVIDMIPAGVGQRQLMDALLITLVNGVFFQRIILNGELDMQVQ